MSFLYLWLISALATLGIVQAQPAQIDVTVSAFASQISEAVSSPTFSPNDFCTAYAAKSFFEACAEALPWASLNPKTVSIVKVLSVDATHGFITSSFQIGTAAAPVVFTALIEDSNWKIALDNKDVWDIYSNTWHKVPYAYGELRFAQLPDSATVEALISIAESDQHFLSQQLNSPILNPLNLYFLNDPNLAQQIGEPWSVSVVSGGARNGFMLFVGDLNTRLNSQILHELVHEYTVYNHDWLGSSSFFPNALLAEGLAVWFQIPFAVQDLGRMSDQVRGYFISTERSDLNIALSYLNGGHLFDLLDNNLFRQLDSQGYHPAYDVGAATIDFLVNQIGIQGLKKIWPILSASDSGGIKKVLLEYGTESEFESYIRTYISAHLTNM